MIPAGKNRGVSLDRHKLVPIFFLVKESRNAVFLFRFTTFRLGALIDAFYEAVWARY